MGLKSYKSVSYHIVFSTKNRLRLITENIREDLYHFIWNKCKHSGLYLHRLGGTEDHIHMLVYIPPKFAVAGVIGQIKGASAFFVNRKLSGDDMLYWQRGYGVLTVSERDIPAIRDYIIRQQEHHAKNTTFPDFETSTMDEE